MPDITMCEGGNCPAKSTCYRAVATPSEHRQSYFTVPPRDNDNCYHYIGINEGREVGFRFAGVEEKSGAGIFELNIDAASGTLYLSREMFDAITEMWDAANH